MRGMSQWSLKGQYGARNGQSVRALPGYHSRCDFDNTAEWYCYVLRIVGTGEQHAAP